MFIESGGFLLVFQQHPTKMGGQYIHEAEETGAFHTNTVLFSMKEEVGALARVLKIFQVICVEANSKELE